MESLLGFEEEVVLADGGDGQKSSSQTISSGYKLVPWLNWDEWEWVRDSLFSDSPAMVFSGLKRVSTWRSRGCLPVVVDVTASIIEIQQKDPLCRKDLCNDAVPSEQMLAMLYCMAIIRLVNCVVEKTRNRTGISIADAAGAIGIPRTLIDIRHEGSHRDLPSLSLVRDSAAMAIHWLKSYYWEPQTKQIPFQKDGTASVRKEINSRFHELASSLKDRHNLQPGSSPMEGKRSKKQTVKALKTLVQLYSTFSSEVLSVLLELLLKALDLSSFEDFQKEDHGSPHVHTLLHDWKLVVSKFTRKEPELLLMLLKAVLTMIETQENMKYIGTDLTSLECIKGTGQVEQLSSLFSWLVGQLRGIKHDRHRDAKSESRDSATGVTMSNALLMDVLRKCLLASSCGNEQLMDSSLRLAQLIDGRSSLMEKLNKLNSVASRVSEVKEENSSLTSSNDFLSQQDELIHQATEKLELVKLIKRKGEVTETTRDDTASSGRWIVAKSWNPCPIGMLPRKLGSSGRLPTLENDVDDDQSLKNSSERKQIKDLKQHNGIIKPICDNDLLDNPNSSVEKMRGKRESSCDICLLDDSSVKKMRETIEKFEQDGEHVSWAGGVEGCLMIDGAWKKVREEELLAIGAGVRILV